MGKKKKPNCEKHKIGMTKRQVVREGETRYFCLQCEEDKKIAQAEEERKDAKGEILTAKEI